MNKTIEKLLDAVNGISDKELRKATMTVFDTPGFGTAPASLSFHHAYEGGLAIHTLEVLSIALESSHLNPDVIIAAAIWHDVAKVREYEMQWMRNVDIAPSLAAGRAIRGAAPYGDEIYTWGKSKDGYARLIGHISGSFAMFCSAAYLHDVPQQWVDAVGHCLLSHHGAVREWGSPVAPQTLEAQIIHNADMVSAKYGATKDAP